jgi:hypothetical protein
MMDPETHFEQVPVEDVVKNLGQQLRPEKNGAAENGRSDCIQKQLPGAVDPTPKHTVHRFDIFRQEPDGNVLWQGSAASLDDAKLEVEKFAASSPGTYLVVDFRTRAQVTITCARTGSAD